MWLNIFQICLALILIVTIILQAKSGGLGSTFGAMSYHTRRGAEKTIFYTTILTALLFVVVAAINALG